MTERVSNEQADLMARCGYDPIIQIGLAPPINASDLAADLLDARVEIERLRADRDCDGNGMTCTHRAALRRCHDLLERAQNLPFIDTNNEWDKWDADVEAELLACDKAGECPAVAAQPGGVTLNNPCPRCGYHDAALAAWREGK